jgi:hypothetical protein
VATTLSELLGAAQAIVGDRQYLRLVFWRLRQARPEDALARHEMDAMLHPGKKRGSGPVWSPPRA